ncbi:MAG: hypothetical protein PHX21_13210 [bacterium]|nr:hypothetical protein [bacterium]
MNLLLILSLFAQTPEISSNFSNNLDVRSWKKETVDTTTKLDTASIENTLSFSAQWLYFNGFLEALYLNNEIHLKKRISFDAPNVSFLLGDFYETYGNGLMFGMTARESKGYERRINGAKVSTKLGCVTLSEIYGNPLVIDRANQKYSIIDEDSLFLADPTDKIAGLNVSVPIPLAQTIFNVRGLEIKRDSGGLLLPTYMTIIGGEVKLNTGWCEFNAEALRKTNSDTLDTLGYGAYLNTKIYLGSYVVGMQGLYYEQLNTYKYACLPTLNKNEYSINEGKDELGYKFSLQKAFEELILNSYFSNTFPRLEKDANNHKKSLIESFADIEFKDISASFRMADLDSGIVPHYKNKQQIEGEFAGEIKMFRAELSFSKVTGTSLLDSTIDFYDVGFGLDFFINEQFTLYSTYTVRSKEELTESPGKLWAGIGLKVNVLDKVLGEIWYGNEKGGLVCSGGTCRWVDPYDGLKAKVNLSF